MALVISVMLLIVGAYLAHHRPMWFIIYFGFVASSYDAAGVALYFDEHNPAYRLIFNYLLIYCAVKSVYTFFNRYKNSFVTVKNTGKYIVASCLLVVLASISNAVFSINESYNIILNLPYVLVDYTSVIFIVLACNYYDYEEKRSFENLVYIFVCFQVLFAFLIVYLPNLGVNFLDKFSGAKYIPEGSVYNNIKANLFDIPDVLKNKYTFNGLGQFHNGNDMGFYGAVGMMLTAFKLTKKNNRPIVIASAVAIFTISLLLWCNSGMRGPIVGIIVGVAFYIAFSSTLGWKKKIVLFLIPVIMSIFFSGFAMQVADYFIGAIFGVSGSVRAELRHNGFQFISDKPLFGAGGYLQFLTEGEMNPHELPLRMACLFGVLTGIVCAFLTVLFPLIDMIINKTRRLLPVLCMFDLLFVAFTNCYTDVVLFWLLFCEAVFGFNNSNDDRSEKRRSENGAMKKILYVSRGGLPIEASGIRTYRIAKILKDGGCSVSFLCNRYLTGTENQKLEGISFVDVPCFACDICCEYDGMRYFYMRDAKHDILCALKHTREVITAKKIFDRVVFYCEKNDIDTIILYNDTYGLTKRLLDRYKGTDIKVYGDITEWYDQRKIGNIAERLIPFLVNRRIEKLDRYLDGAIVISKYLYDYYQEIGVRSLLVPPLMSEIAKDIRKNDSSQIKFIYAGSPGSKDILFPFVDSMIEKNKHEQRFLLSILGVDYDYFLSEGYKREGLEEYGVKVLGRVNGSTVLSELDKSDFGILLRYNKRYAKAGFSTKFAEACSRGVAMICNEIGGTDSFIENGYNGFLIKDFDKETIKCLLDKLSVMTREEIDDIKRNALTLAREKFDAEIYREKLTEFIKK